MIGTVIASAYLPYSFKALAGPVVDRFPTRRFGRRRHFILTAQLLMGATFLALPMLDPHRHLGLIMAALIVHNSFVAIQDVATDGLAVDTLPADERGKANSIMWAAKAGGTAAGGSIGVVLAKHVGWTTLFVSIAVLVWAIMLFVLFVRERPAGPSSEEAARERLDFRVLWRSFAFATPLFAIAIALFTPAGYALAGAVLTPTLRSDVKLSEEAIGTLTFLDTPLGIGGALLGGFLADRVGPRKTMAAFMAGLALSLAIFAATRPWWSSMVLLVAFTILSSISQYAYNAASLGFFMTLSNPLAGATQFAVYMAATNFTYSLTAKAGGWMADNWGVPRTFAIAAVIQLVTIAFLPFCDPSVAEARFRRSNTAASAPAA